MARKAPKAAIRPKPKRKKRRFKLKKARGSVGAGRP
jgi:hypothetical protein